MPPSDRRAPAIRPRSVAAALLMACWLTAPAAARPPEEGKCPSVSALDESGRVAEDATPLLLREGMLIDEEGLLALQSLLPKEIWRHREVFFFEGMMMEIGPCHRRYGIPRFYIEATRLHAGKVKLDDDGNLLDYTAGVPFPQDGIEPSDPQAAIKWAWNFQKRYRGAGYRGPFRITSFPTSAGGVERYRGSFFFFQVAERADLATTDYRWPGTKKKLWVAGGEFRAPFNVRELAWRQFRKPKSERRWRTSDDVFVYVPSMRKMRRSGTSWVDGLFMPRYSITDLGSGGSITYGEGGSVSPTAGRSAAVSEDARTGLTGLTIRPNAYQWRLLGEQTVLAPLNGLIPGYPTEEQRNYGPSGLSVASDRWDVRRAVVIEGLLRQRDDAIDTITLYIDYHTLQPLYWVSRAGKRRMLDIGIFVHRYTGDVPAYPEWPDGIQAHAFEPVAASFFDALAGRGGWLRESYDLSSLPYTEAERKRMVSADPLQRGR